MTLYSGAGLGQGSSSSAGPADEDFTVFFALFSRWKKVRSAGQEVSAQLDGRVSSSTLSAHQMARAGEPVDSVGSDEWVLMRTPDIGKSNNWNRRTRLSSTGITVVWSELAMRRESTGAGRSRQCRKLWGLRSWCCSWTRLLTCPCWPRHGGVEVPQLQFIDWCVSSSWL